MKLWKPVIKKYICTGLFTLALVIISSRTFSQTNGDYRTRSSGNWTSRNTWQVYNNGWVNCSNGDYPGASSGTGTVTILPSHDVTLNTSPSNTLGALIIESDLTYNRSYTLNVTGDFILAAGTLYLSVSNNRTGTLTVGGNFLMTGGTITESANRNGEIIFNNNGIQNFVKTGGSISNNIIFTVNAGSELDMGDYVLDGSSGSFILSAGATLTTANTEGISSSGPTGSIQVTGTRTYSSGAAYVYNGTSAQITGDGLPSTISSLTTDNPSGVTLTNTTTVSNTLSMIQGNIITGTNTFILSGSSLSHTAGTVCGKFQRNVTSTALHYLFPVGTTSYCNPLEITFTNLTQGYLAVEFKDEDIGTAGLPLDDAGTEITGTCPEGYWTMTAVGSMASTDYDVSLNYSSFSSVNSFSRILKRTAGGNLTADGTHGSLTPPEISRNGMNGISSVSTDLAIGRSGPRIVTHPSDATGCNSSFSVTASGTPTLTYQWQEDDGNGFTDISDSGIYSGAETSTLTLTAAPMTMNGYLYRCVVTDGNGSPAISDIASLTLTVVTLGYSYSSEITLAPASGPSDLTDFPALISITASPDCDRLKTTANGGHVSSADGYDIIFTDQDGNKLDHQTEEYEPLTGQLTAWVRIPVLSVSSSTTINMLYGNPAINTDQSVNSVWTSNYKGVWHLNGNDYTDASLYGNDGTHNATVDAGGKIAGAKDFNGSSSYVMTPTNGMTDNDNNQAISVWGYYSSTPSGSRNLITFQNADSSSAIQLGFRGGNTVAWKWNGAELVNAGTAPSVNTWHYYVYTYDGTTSRLYIDGIERASSTVAPQTAMPDECNIGRYNDGEYIDAVIDEPRFSTSTKTAGWILTEYNNQNDPDSFISLGPESSNDILATIGACQTSYTLDQGYPAGGSYSGTGVSGTNFDASIAGLGSHQISYSYTDIYGCTNIVSKDIIVTPIPSPPAASDKECCYLNIVDLEAGGTNLKWYSDAALTQLEGTGTPFPTAKTTSGIYTYYVTQTLNGCESSATTVTLTINRGITINTHPQPVTLCEGDDAYFSVSAMGYNIVYQWQEDGSDLTDGGIYSGTTTATLTLTDPCLTASGRTYRCVLTTTCGPSPVTSDGATLTVTPQPVATFSYPGNPYCPNASNPLPVFSGGGIAGTFSSSSGLVFANILTGEIDIAASTPGSYTITNTIAPAGGCGEVTATAPFEIISSLTWTGSVNSDWNEPGNWICNYIPNINMSVSVPDVSNNPVISTGLNAEVKNLIINPGASLIVDGNSLRISGDITNNGTLNAANGTVELSGSATQTISSNTFDNNTINNLIINNTAGVILLDSLKISGIVTLENGNLTTGGYLTLLSSATQTAMIAGSGNGSLSGNITMQRYLPSRFGYKYFSSPFQSATVNEFSDEMDLGTTFPMFYRYDESRTSSGWVAYNNPSDILHPLHGYAANFGSQSVPVITDITGQVNDGSVSVTLYNNNNPWTEGFNLVGNPYPSAVDWDIPAGWTKTNIDDALYYFKASTTDQYGGTYSSYVGTVSSDELATNIIPSMQGFFVHVSDGSFPVEAYLEVNNNARITDLTHSFLKSGKGPSKPLIRLAARFSDDPASADPLVVYFDEKAMTSFDSSLDALKLMNTDLNVPSLYALSSDGMKLSVNGQPLSLMNECTIPLGIKTSKNGNITFYLSSRDEVFTGTGICLKDNITGNIHDLSVGNEYNVALPAGEILNRFSLIISESTDINDIPNGNNIFNAYYSGGTLKINVAMNEGSTGTVSVINMTGIVLFTENIYGSGYYEFNPNLSPGICIVIFDTGKIKITKKIFIYGQ